MAVRDSSCQIGTTIDPLHSSGGVQEGQCLNNCASAAEQGANERSEERKAGREGEEGGGRIKPFDLRLVDKVYCFEHILFRKVKNPEVS